MKDQYFVLNQAFVIDSSANLPGGIPPSKTMVARMNDMNPLINSEAFSDG